MREKEGMLSAAITGAVTDAVTTRLAAAANARVFASWRPGDANKRQINGLEGSQRLLRETRKSLSPLQRDCATPAAQYAQARVFERVKKGP